jgi:hypothetical protein
MPSRSLEIGADGRARTDNLLFTNLPRSVPLRSRLLDDGWQIQGFLPVAATIIPLCPTALLSGLLSKRATTKRREDLLQIEKIPLLLP